MELSDAGKHPLMQRKEIRRFRIDRIAGAG
jgi:hypothetical protein